MTEPQPAPRAWHTVAGTIRQGMKVFTADGTCLGTVQAVEGEEVLLTGDDPDDLGAFVTLTQISGVGPDGVLLSNRGDETFGLGAEP